MKAPPAILRATPNTLSSLRLVLAGILPLVGGRWWLTLVVVAGLSDWLDGLLARRWGITSWMGGILDGIADKAFVLSALLVLSTHGCIPGWWVPLLLSRDVAVATGTSIALIRRNRAALRNLGSRLFGKVTTILVFVLLVVALAYPTRGKLHGAVFALAAAASMAAAVDYGRVRLRTLAVRGARES